jgi:hypothetical protein
MGILVGDTSGNLNLTGNVTRAQFAKMMVAASSYRDSIGEDATGYSLFRDVKSSYWASAYIKIAVEQGWLIGYTDGTFRPYQTITLEQACTAVLRMLGYSTSDLAGTYPTAQLSKAASLGLRDQITLARGGVMTRMDCARLLYNLMTASTKAGQTYAVTVGYTVTNGQLDYASIVEESLSGPFVSESGSLSLPFASSTATVYLDGETSALSAVGRYDVYYYNTNLRTVWVYTDRAAGTITAVSPSTASPSSVTVGGKTYTIGTASAAYKLSAMGGFAVGDTAVLLLGMDGSVADVVSGSEADTVYYGIVTASAKALSSSDSAAAVTNVTVACTDGAEHVFSVAGSVSYTVGTLVSADVNGDGTTVTRLSALSVSGSVNASATSLGSLTLADDVQILDTTSDGAWAKIYPSRLASATLSASAVRYYTLNASGSIDRLILNNATGDTWTYCYVTAAQHSGTEEDGTKINPSYTYLAGGTSHTIAGTTNYSIHAGGAALWIDSDGSIRAFRQMTSASVTSLGSLYATCGNQKLRLSDDIQVYLKKDSSYYLTALSAVNTANYTLTAWYDSFGCPAGGRVRVLIAEAK